MRFVIQNAMWMHCDWKICWIPEVDAHCLPWLSSQQWPHVTEGIRGRYLLGIAAISVALVDDFTVFASNPVILVDQGVF